jgi:hypothetical protein
MGNRQNSVGDKNREATPIDRNQMHESKFPEPPAARHRSEPNVKGELLEGHAGEREAFERGALLTKEETDEEAAAWDRKEER